MSKRRMHMAAWSVSRKMIEGLEERKLLASGKIDPADGGHSPGLCPCAGCQPRQNDRPSLTEFLKTNPAPAAGAPVGAPLSSVPILHSRPGLARRLYIDFNGAPAFDWTNTNGEVVRVHGPGGDNVAIPAFSLDANLNDFTTNEDLAMREIWRHVSEKYSIFDVDVTTEDPGVYADNLTARVIVGGSNSDWAGGGGGVASINGFNVANRDNTSFVWSADAIDAGSTTINLTDRHFIADTIAHEAGHTFGLVHQRQGNGVMITNEYYAGDSTRAPIMGDSSNNSAKYGRWWVTNWESGQQSTDDTQDDRTFLGTILGNRADDWISQSEGAPSYASTDNQGHWNASGIINSFLDQDAFRFNASGPTASFTLTNAAEGAMLKPRLEMRTWPGNVLVATSNSSGTNTYTVSAANLTIGNVYIVVASSDFTTGSMGQFTLAGTVQAFASVSNGVLTVNGFDNVNDDIQLDLYFLDQTYVYVDNAIDGNPSQVAAVLIPYSQVNSIVISTRSGYDNVRFLSTIGVTPVSVDMGDGIDNLELRGGSGQDVFTVNGSAVTYQYQNITFNDTVTALTCRGYAGDDSFTVYGNPIGTNLAFYGGDNNDTASIGSTTMGSGSNAITFLGENGSDTLIVGDGGTTAARSFTVGTGVIAGTGAINTSIGGSLPRTIQNQTTEVIRLIGSENGDEFNVNYAPVGQNVRAECYGGNDTINVGSTAKPFSQDVRGEVSVLGGNGDDSVIVDDSTWGSVGNYSVTFNRVTNTFVANGVTLDLPTESLELRSRSGGSTTYTSPAFTSPGVGRHFRFSDAAGAGTGILIIDDRPVISQMVGLDLYSDRIVHHFNSGGTYEFGIDYSGFEAMTIYGSNITNTINVYGLNPNNVSGQQTTLIMGSGADTVTLFPHDAEGNRTLNSNFGIGGGGGLDKMIVDDTAATEPTVYAFENTFGAGTQNIYGMGTAGGFGQGTDLEQIIINAGSGDDSFDLNSFKSGLAVTINGGAGNDTLNYGKLNSITEVTSLGALRFDGQDDYDSLNYNNTATTGNFTYTRNAGLSLASSSSPAYSTGITDFNTEMVRFNDGPQAGTLNLNVVPAGSAVEFNGAGGIDSMNVGSIAANNLSSIEGIVTYNGGAAGGSMVVRDSADASGDVAHLTPSSLGAHPSDTLFGVGGALYFTGLANSGPNPGITLNLGSDADTVYATPLIDARVTINGNNPTDAPGDFIGLALADVTSPSFVPGATGAGTWNSTSHQALNYTGFESTDSDSAAPEFLAQNFAIAQAGPMNVNFQFNEDLSPVLSNASLGLVNVDDSTQIPTADIFYAWDGGTNSAVFTFDNYQYGALPDGNYFASLGTVTDLYGNAAINSGDFSFFFLQGDSTQDRKVDTQDFNVLAGNFGAGTTFAEGDLTFDASIDSVDFTVLLAQYGKTLPEPMTAPTASAPTASVFSRQEVADEADTDLITV